MSQASPHEGASILLSGSPLGQAERAVILLHGRGGSAEDILRLGESLDLKNFTLLAPQATGHTWYPESFMAPLATNEPWLSSALSLVESLVLRCVQAGVSTPNLSILGFSQGACLATEYVARYPRHYATLIAFTGGLIGAADSDLHHEGRLAGTTALLSSGDPDPHVPWSRVETSAKELMSMGATVQLMRHVDRPHTILHEEVMRAIKLIGAAD